jgi:hypothetical protein
LRWRSPWPRLTVNHSQACVARCKVVAGLISRREIRQPDQELLNVLATIGSQIGQFIERKPLWFPERSQRSRKVK